LESQAAAPDFWKDQAAAQRVLQRQRRLKDDRVLIDSLQQRSEDLSVLIDWAEQGEPVDDELNRALDELNAEVEAAEIKRLLGGEHDRKSAILTIHPGAGGTESQDWAEMLLRLYLRWTEQRGFSREVIDLQPGDEAGIKSVTLTVNGDYAYGLLLAKAGVHRLVRISPYDQAGRRHTSFASVFAYPEVDDTVDIEVNPADLRVDTYRASGAGGQHVNKTDSAVRLTHLPTGIVVQCQNDRSQHRNRAEAMNMLRARLYEAEMRKRREDQQGLEDSKSDIGWGSQIRSYVLDQSRIKDLRTGVETGNTQGVLDGNLRVFIEASLKQGL